MQAIGGVTYGFLYFWSFLLKLLCLHKDYNIYLKTILCLLSLGIDFLGFLFLLFLIFSLFKRERKLVNHIEKTFKTN